MTDQDHSVDLTSPEPPPSTVEASAAPDADLALTPDGPPTRTARAEPARRAARRRRRGSRGGRGRRRPGGRGGGEQLDDPDGAADDELADDAGDAHDGPVGAGTESAERWGPRTAEQTGSRRTGGELPDELPDRPIEGHVQDVRGGRSGPHAARPRSATAVLRRCRLHRLTSGRPESDGPPVERAEEAGPRGATSAAARPSRRTSGRSQAKGRVPGPVALDPDVLERRRGASARVAPSGVT